nr:YkgJ family cysteine cluster protein [Candidatus Njordarchaeota archaeon]
MRFTCQTCGECCKKYAIPVTSSDIHHIIKFTGLHPTGFLTLMEPDDSVIQTYRDFPKIRLKDGDNFVLTLSQQDKECIFLRNNKCRIYEARPLVCRPFPFEYSIEKGGKVEFSVNEEARTFCKGLGKGSRDFDFSELRRSTLAMESHNDAFRKKAQKWNAKASNRKIKSSRMGVLIEFLTTDINQEHALLTSK